MIKLLPIVMASLLLASCFSDEDSVKRGPQWEANRQGLIYSYPMDGQLEVPGSAPVIIHFSSEITDSFPEDAIVLRDAADNVIPYSHVEVDNGHGLVLTPEQRLAPLTEYQLEINGLNLANGEAAARTLSFVTRGLVDGPSSQVAGSGDFDMLRMIPDGEQLPITTFSNLRLQFTRPLNAATVRYGDTLSLEGPHGPVDARVLVSGPYLTIDPVDELAAQTQYTLHLSGAIESRDGTSFVGASHSFQATSTGSRSIMVQDVVDEGDGPLLSRLTGEPINMMPLQAVLLGDDNASRQSGEMHVELAHIPSFPDNAPMRIARGSMLTGTELEIRIGGEVPAGFASGEVKVHLISDAMGFFLENPYSSDLRAPRLILLYLDVAVSTEDSRASGAVTQNLLHLEMIGTVMAEDGRMVVDAVAVAEPQVLGVETARSQLSFHMRGFLDPDDAPPPVVDDESPTLIASTPGDNDSLARPDDPIVLLFSEPLDGNTIRPGETLFLNQQNGPSIPFDYKVDGAALILTPQAGLSHGAGYEVDFTDGITDLAGNPADTTEVPLTFELPVYVATDEHSPIALTTFPGFPCITVDHDLDAGSAGRCSGGQPDDDHMPLARMPAGHGIRVTFSQDMDSASINQDTFLVEQVDETGASLGNVEGTLRVANRAVEFVPAEPWETDTYYRYTLRSIVDTPLCGSDAICDQRGLPLQTRMLAESPDQAPLPTDGGPDLPIYFVSAPASNDVFQQLRNLPTADINANFLIDIGEPLPSADPEVLRNSTQLIRNPDANPQQDGTAASGNALKDANVGCGFEGDDPLECPDQQYLFLIGNLDVDVVGFVPAEQIDQLDPTIPDQVKDEGGMLVYIHPTRILASGVKVHIVLSDAAQTLNFVAHPADTGPQLMRIRYNCDASIPESCDGPDHGRIQGWIVEEDGEPYMLASLDLYLDAPRLDPEVENHNFDPPEDVNVTHNLRSFPIQVDLAGRLGFLDDGRLQIEQASQDAVPITVELDIENGLLDGNVYLHAPTEGIVINYVSSPMANRN